jgi:molecular chaperone HscB
MNYFSLFDIQQQYQIDIVVLEQRYNMLLSFNHPNQLSSGSDDSRHALKQKLSQINEAFFVLNDPVLRGQHLIEVRGIELPSDQETIGDADFLAEQMDFREALASANSPEAVEALNRNISDSIADYVDRITLHLATELDEDSKSAGLELNKLKFLKKIAAEAKVLSKNKVR